QRLAGNHAVAALIGRLNAGNALPTRAVPDRASPQDEAVEPADILIASPASEPAARQVVQATSEAVRHSRTPRVAKTVKDRTRNRDPRPGLRTQETNQDVGQARRVRSARIDRMHSARPPPTWEADKGRRPCGVIQRCPGRSCVGASLGAEDDESQVSSTISR